MFKKVNKKIKRRAQSFVALQLFIAGTLVILICYTFVSFYRIAKDDALSIGEKAVYEVGEKLNNFLLQGIDVLSVCSDTVDFMIQSKEPQEKIRQYLLTTTEKYKQNYESPIIGIYGIVNNHHIAGSDWEPDESFVPKSRPWYLAAIRAKGHPVIIFPYKDAATGLFIISISRRLSDYSSVISIDIAIDRMQSFTDDFSLNGEGYGFIFDRDSMVVAHTDARMRGTNVLKDETVSEDLQTLVGRIVSYNQPQSVQSSRTFELEIDGKRCMAFSRNVMDNWFVVMVIDTASLFKKIQSNFILNLIVLFLVVGFVIYFCTQTFLGNMNLESLVESQTKKLREQTLKMLEMQSTVIEELATLIEDRDANTGEHVKNTRVYSLLIAKNIYFRKLHTDEVTKTFIRRLSDAAPLHDVGKISVPDSILLNPKKLEPFEFETMKNHTRMGGAIIRRMFRSSVDKDAVQMAVEVAQYHHERWDGTGYPLGISGEDIPLCARILAVADCFDALVSERVYKKAFPPDEAFAIIESESGTHFDPEIVEVFLSLKDKVLAHLESLKKK